MKAGARLRQCGAALWAVGVIAGGARPARATPLDQLIPNLFGGTFYTSITPFDVTDSQQPAVAARFQGLSGALSSARSQAPIPSASGAFSFIWDPDVDTFVRARQSLGPMLAERASTLGRGTLTFSTSYTRIKFDTLEGDPLDNLQTSQPTFTSGFLALLPPPDRLLASNSLLNTSLDFHFSLDMIFLAAAYGLTDSIDVSMALSINHASMRGQALAFMRPKDPTKPSLGYFTVQQQGVIVGGSGSCTTDFTCAQDSFDGDAWGTGDLYLRGKWRFLETAYADLATVSVLTLPTGNADNYLGYHGPTFTPWLVASKAFGRISPHVNLGYAFRDAQDVSQAQWVAGTDVRALNWLTLAADFLGYHDDKRDSINDDVVQSALTFKVNPFDQFVIGGTVQFPLNRDGLRADVIYTAQIEYTF
jgi:hypothetical protein